MRAAIFVVLAALMGGCSTTTAPQTQPVQQQKIPPELAAEYAAYAGSGTASILGQAFLRTRGGEVRVAAGELVTAEPGTLIALEYMKRASLRPAWPEAVATRRSTTADAEGRFTFRDLPAGRWLILSQVYWEVPTSTLVGVTLRPTGGVVFNVVEVEPGAKKEGVVLIPWVQTVKD